VALFKPVGGNVDVWLLETLRGVSNRFTFDTADDIRDGGTMGRNCSTSIWEAG
jgi:hypothetical protein